MVFFYFVNENHFQKGVVLHGKGPWWKIKFDENSIMNKYVKILIFVLTCVGVGYISGMVTRSSVLTWFPTLIKPSFNPPSWVFAPVWSTLYIMMRIAAGLIWSRMDFEKETVRKALLFFAIQLGLNAL